MRYVWRYFFSNVLQFQIHRAMCTASRQYDPQDPSKPLHKCDIFRQPAAGNILKQLMERGASEPWQQVLQEVIGEGRLDGTALREYFRPLEEWLRNENLRTNEYVGWIYDGDYCKHSIETANLQVFGGFYNGAVQVQLAGGFVFGLCLLVQVYVNQLRLI
ncbi:angiotensin-converting-relatedenzyme [Culex quinquefasciatus]|uniref:Angiotensin-converting-relatedenzyme n=1 Tax=Culex quinquefasciatus TaxID=7176 RepID=B0WR97_CULQU|nr:angiotensin-converting-relatedenzyme [Culex quinquefasciatus]|eukprot:XP_001851231.1 angiotensin-converting-relatedenzyme [Culex quinquefasciatus]